MIKGKIKLKRTLDNIKERLTDYEIYAFYIGKFKPGVNISSPFRRDSTPSFHIYFQKDELRHVDYGNNSYAGNCIDFVQQLFDLDFKGAINKIWEDLLDDAGNKKHPIKDIPEICKKWKKIIQVSTRFFTPYELEYWNQYGLNSSDLHMHNVFSIEGLWIDKMYIPTDPDELRFGYLFEDYIKIYKPNNKEGYRFITNAPIDYISGFNRVLKSAHRDIIIITKSLKDEMVLEKLLRGYTTNVCSIQAENIKSLNESQINFFKTNFKQVILNFDNDTTGITVAKYYKDNYNLETIFVPNEYQDCKDFADVSKKYGMIEVFKILKEGGLL